MKTHGYSGKLRFLTICSLLFLITGILIYTLMTLPEKPMLTVLPVEETEPGSVRQASVVNVSLPGAPTMFGPGIELTGPMMRDTHVRKGDTLSILLERENIPHEDARKSIIALTEVYNPRDLRSGQQITLVFEDPDFALFQGYRIRLDGESEALVEKKADGEFSARIARKILTPKLVRIDGKIETTLYNSALKAGLPLSVLYEMIYAYSFDIDFQRDIRPNDSYSVMYEAFTDNTGKIVRSGEIRYAELTVFGQTRKIYRYEDVFGDSDFYDTAGKSIRKQLLRTPIDIPRLTSGYGMRIHPIYGYGKVHKGLDFGAPQGTPIRVAGDGTVASMTYNATYGNHIIVNHPNEYSTLYAHMVSFKRGMKKGQKIKQGEIIGYVGATGLVTGPHLHYEVRFRRVQVNPSSLKFPPGKKLGGLDLTRFVIRRAEIELDFSELAPETAPDTETVPVTASN